jgi:hypothetical protein
MPENETNCILEFSNFGISGTVTLSPSENPGASPNSKYFAISGEKNYQSLKKILASLVSKFEAAPSPPNPNPRYPGPLKNSIVFSTDRLSIYQGLFSSNFRRIKIPNKALDGWETYEGQVCKNQTPNGYGTLYQANQIIIGFFENGKVKGPNSLILDSLYRLQFYGHIDTDNSIVSGKTYNPEDGSLVKVVKRVTGGGKAKMVSIVNYYSNGKMIERRDKADRYGMGFYENGQIAWRKDLSDFATKGVGLGNVGFDLGGRFSSIDTCAYGKKNGFCMNFAGNSRVASHGAYRDGHKHDKQFFTYRTKSRYEGPPADRIKSVCGYKLGKKHGPACYYSKNLVLTSKIHYLHGLVTGDSNFIFKQRNPDLLAVSRPTEYRGSLTKTLDNYTGTERVYTDQHKLGLFEINLYYKSILRRQESHYDLQTGKIH